MTFLSAEWRNLVMANYAVSPTLLQGFVPQGVELDLFEGTCYVSLVGFMFMKTRILGLPIPFHVNFEEVNLRFYVRKKVAGEWRRGVVFVKEIVPRAAISFVARTVYREPYQTMPMRHHWDLDAEQKTIDYQWKYAGVWHIISATADKQSLPMAVGSEEEFITEHYYGYTRWNERITKEYEVRHPRWLVNPVKSYRIEADFGALYGEKFRFLQAETPTSVLMAEGSEVKVMGKQEAK